MNYTGQCPTFQQHNRKIENRTKFMRIAMMEVRGIGGLGRGVGRASGGQGSRVHPLRIASSPLSTTRTLVLIDLFTVRALYEAVTLRVFKFRRVSVVFRGDHIRL